MTPTPEVQQRLRRYLLGQLDDEAREEVEKDLFANDETYQELLVVEDEMVDEYLADKLGQDDRSAFENNFLGPPERRQKLRFGRALNRYVSAHPEVRSTSERPEQRSAPPQPYRSLFSSRLLMVACAVLVIAGGFVVWRSYFHQSDVDKGLIALNQAYREQRPLESRISNLDYAPFPQTRGSNTPDRFDPLARNRAESILSGAVTEDPTAAAAHHAIGKVYLAKKQFDDAIKEFDAALKNDSKNAQLYSDLGAAWLEKGKIDLDKGKADPASSLAGKGMEELGRSLENINKALALNPNLLEALFNRALIRQYMRLTQQAADDWRNYLKLDSDSPWANEARENLKRLEEQTNKASTTSESLFQDFANYRNQGNDDDAWAVLKSGRSRTGNMVIEEALDEYLGHIIKGESDAAEESLGILSYAGKLETERVGDRYISDLAAFYVAAQTRDHKPLILAREKLTEARTLYKASEFDRAQQAFEAVQTQFSSVGDDCEALLSEMLAAFCAVRNSRPRTSETFERLAAVFESRRYLSLACQSLQAVGDAESGKHEFSRTLELANRALKQADQIQDSDTAVHCLAQLLSTYVSLGDHARSLDYFARAIDLSSQLPRNPRLVWPIYYDVALDFYFLGLPDTAIAFAREALNIANDANAALLRSRSWERMGILAAEQKNYSEAIEDGKRALAESEKIESSRSRADMTAHSKLRLGQMNCQVGNPQEALDYFHESIQMYEEMGSEVYAYEAHKGQLIAYLQLRDDQAARAELPKVVDLFEANRAKIVDETDRNKFFDAGASTYELAIDFSYRTESKEAALAYAEQSRARSLFESMQTGVRISGDKQNPELQLDAQTKPLTVDQIQGGLPDKAQLVEYAVLNDRVIIWVITRSLVRSAESQISARDLEAKVGNFHHQISHSSLSNSAAVEEQATELYTMLISPVKEYIDPARLLVIVPDASINYLPFESLISPASKHFLIEDYTVEQSPSATIFVECSRQAQRFRGVRDEKLLSVGNPRFDRVRFNLPDLPTAAREAEQVAGVYRPATLLIGPDATALRVRDAMPRADVIHLATHAIADERSPLLSELLMARDNNADDAGVLEAQNLYEMKLPHTRLVVLSACGTAIERSYRGEGSISLARPFLAAGVPLVVASLWPVDSNATADSTLR